MTFSTSSAIVLALALARSSMAATGDLDTTFGQNGVALTGLVDVDQIISRCAPTAQPDGKILLCGTRFLSESSESSFFVARFTADGHLDPTFSFDGLVTIDFDGGSDFAAALALQSDGRIVVVGRSSNPLAPSTLANFAIARLLDDGTLDPEFGGGTGRKRIAFDLDAGDGEDVAADVAIQPDGRIVVAGTVATTSNGTDFGVVRLLPDGSPDSSFNLTGKVVVGLNLAGSANFDDAAMSVAIDTAGRILVAGNSDNGSLGSDFSIVRLLPNGALDPNFDSDGRAHFGFDVGMSANDQLSGMTLQHDGRILLVGAADVSPTSTINADIGLMRLQPDGTLDAGFGFSGKTLVSFDLVPDGFELAGDVVEQADGKLDVGGAAASPTANLLAVMVQLNADGSPDVSFGTFGKRVYDFGLTAIGGQAILNLGFQGERILASGIVIVPGPNANSVIDDFIVRLADDTVFANGFE